MPFAFLPTAVIIGIAVVIGILTLVTCVASFNNVIINERNNQKAHDNIATQLLDEEGKTRYKK